MKYVPSPLIGRLSKSAGSITAAYNKFGSYLRNRVTPTNPQSSFQNTVRGQFGDLATGWRTLSDVQKEGWISLGTNMERQDSLGQTYTLTGLQAYISVNHNLQTTAQTLVTNAPALQLPDVPAVGTLTISAAGGTVSLAYTPPADGEFVLVFVSRPVSDGKMFLSSSEYKLIKVAANADTSPIALGTLYTTRFGSITGKAGDKVFLRLVTVNAKGFASTHIQSTAIIGA